MFINDKYRVSVDARNIVLEKYIAPKEQFKKVDGVKVSKGMSKASYELVGYYPSHRAMLRGFAELELRSIPQSYLGLCAKIDELYELISGLPISYVYQCNCKKLKSSSDEDKEVDES